MNDARTGIHPGPGPRGTPVEAWSLPVGTVNFSPVVKDGSLYFGGRDRRMRAVHAVTGAERWSFTASDEIEGAAAVGGGIVAFTDVSGALFGVDAETGLQRWRGAGNLFQGASPALIGDSVYVGGGDGQLYGYEIAQKIRERSGGAFAPSEGTLYPALHRLEADGALLATWRESDRGPRRRYYSLTPKGAAALRESLSEWGSFVASVESVAGGGSHG